MSYVILDLEWNGTYSRTAQKFVNEIIEFGAVKLDDELNVVDTFSSLIAPKIGKKLSGKVKELTKINFAELVDDGVDFFTAADSFAKFLGDSTLMTWGTSDIHALIENYIFYKDDYHIPFLKSYCDLQEYCQRALDRYDAANQMGLGVCAELLGIEFSEDEQHRAEADALLSRECFVRVYGRYPISSCLLKADCEEFYNRMMFKNYFITDLNFPGIDKNDLKFNCDLCGKRARRVKRWKLHNKNFTSDFYCKNCDHKFTARVSFKRRYDGIKVNRRIVEKKPKQETYENGNNQNADKTRA